MSENILHFWADSEAPGRKYEIETAYFDIIYKCKGTNGCGRNIPNANIKGTLIHCDNCGKVYSIQPVNWSGQH